jgi:hypothetical protein
MRPLDGIEEIRSAALKLGADNPLAHHVTNIVITPDEGDRVGAQSKGIAVREDGSCASATYIDTLRRENGRWRISHRVILRRRTPLSGAHIASREARSALTRTGRP